MKPGRLSDKSLIKMFLVQREGVNVSAITWPDEDPKAPDKEIDAIGIRPDGTRVALEHTSVDVLPDQRQQRHIITSNYGPAFKQLSEHARTWDKHVRVTLPPGLARPGLKWKEAGQTIVNTIEQEQPKLKASSSGELQDISFHISGQTYKARIFCYKAQGRGTFLVTWGYEPSEAATFGGRVQKTVIENVAKLLRYKSDKTLLLIENNDISLFNEGMLVKALNGLTFPSWFGELWYADMCIPEQPIVMRLHPKPHEEHELVVESSDAA